MLQRRSPGNLARLIDNTWHLYRHLPRAQRPSARRQAFLYEPDGVAVDGEGNGRLLICPPAPVLRHNTEGSAWTQLLAELTNKPGRVIIDLTETLRTLLTGIPGGSSEEVIFLAREIKGLERATVLVYGLNILYERALRIHRRFGERSADVVENVLLAERRAGGAVRLERVCAQCAFEARAGRVKQPFLIRLHRRSGARKCRIPCAQKHSSHLGLTAAPEQVNPFLEEEAARAAHQRKPLAGNFAGFIDAVHFAQDAHQVGE